MPTTPANLYWNKSQVSSGSRERRYGQVGRVVWFTGLSGSGKSTIANEVERKLYQMGRHVYLIDGDNLRHGLCSDLGFSATDRTENIRRAAEVAKLLADAGFICLAAFISPFRADRDRARSILPPGHFLEAYVATPIEVCRKRDPKGLYMRADRGELKEFTGVSAPYEVPHNPELVIHAGRESVEESVSKVLAAIGEDGDASALGI
ncbi:MAG: adenylyl-sulfate kinase [Opitutus sp.]